MINNIIVIKRSRSEREVASLMFQTYLKTFVLAELPDSLLLHVNGKEERFKLIKVRNVVVLFTCR